MRVLDIDDTVLDFHKAEAEAVKKTLRHLEIEPTDAVVTRYSEINDAQWKLLEKGQLTRAEVKLRRFKLLFDELGVVRDAEYARTYYEETLSHGHFFMPGAETLLERLFGRYELYAVSNGTTAVQNGRMESAGIKRYFQRIFLSEEIGAVKPSKEFFDRCFAEIPHLDREQSIILGDSLTSDIQGGINAGIKTCHYCPRGAAQYDAIRPDFSVTTLDEFVELLAKL
ncbi:MAG: YjjG family noncanonical pyrimidine nucleotidase [Clostridia bacterium]|nr:YjjG family noncanonical pyrimidine nucleotidase [Clostridia bacterium]